MGPLRAIALEAYEQLNKGVAKCVHLLYSFCL